ncbi:hypothetical protein OIDMADRAFT_146519 [Oidiodendron maius Zn]|uniref:Uncharacterized protein n=1 Tax=Oidiodendron maius (strain Zn) TaxID=913774 RepID=A0A0C3CIK7_OIDMZ|nr:hypothetical protein OIDMADRAFT_146519 [Oidiodendron maius Zn]
MFGGSAAGRADLCGVRILALPAGSGGLCTEPLVADRLKGLWKQSSRSFCLESDFPRPRRLSFPYGEYQKGAVSWGILRHVVPSHGRRKSFLVTFGAQISWTSILGCKSIELVRDPGSSVASAASAKRSFSFTACLQSADGYLLRRQQDPRDLWLGEGLPVPVAVVQYIVVDNYRELSRLAPVTQKLETADLTWKQKELCD